MSTFESNGEDEVKTIIVLKIISVLNWEVECEWSEKLINDKINITNEMDSNEHRHRLIIEIC